MRKTIADVQLKIITNYLTSKKKISFYILLPIIFHEITNISRTRIMRTFVLMNH